MEMDLTRKMSPQVYVTGFLFGDDGSDVLLIRKTRPEWQAGKLNGIGGKVEDGECPASAMSREFAEETGVCFEDWELTIRHEGPDWVVFYYRGHSTGTIDAVLKLDTYPTDEVPEVWSVHSPEAAEHFVRNIKWAIPLSNDRHGLVFPVVIVDTSSV